MSTTPHTGHVTKCGTDTYPYKHADGERLPATGILAPSYVPRCDTCNWMGAVYKTHDDAAQALTRHAEATS